MTRDTCLPQVFAFLLQVLVQTSYFTSNRLSNLYETSYTNIDNSLSALSPPGPATREEEKIPQPSLGDQREWPEKIILSFRDHACQQQDGISPGRFFLYRLTECGYGSVGNQSGVVAGRHE
jgi:hypothetical protein